MTRPTFRPRSCEICRRSIPHASTGRPRLTCSDRCRQIKRRRYDYHKWIHHRDFQKARVRAKRQLRRYEARFGDLTSIPAYPHDPLNPMTLRDRLLIYLSRGMRVLDCWTCDRPYMPDGQRTPTCSDSCARYRREYMNKLEATLYKNPGAWSSEIGDYIRNDKRLGVCAHCDAFFIPTRSDRKYCSPKCRKLAWWYHHKYGVVRQPFGWQPKKKKCELCGEKFYPSTANKQSVQICCTRACYEQLNTRRKAQRRQAARPQRYCTYCNIALPKDKFRKYCKNCADIASNESKLRYRERQRLV